MRFQAFDQPDESAPVEIIAAVSRPEQITTTIQRDVFGKPLSVKSGGTYNAQALFVTLRSITHDLTEKSTRDQHLHRSDA